MRGTSRTVSPIAFCVVIVVSIVGCRTGRENNELSVSPTPAGAATSATGKSVDGATSSPAGVDAPKRVSEPNESTSPARPPIVYGRGPDILPLSDEQVRRVKGIVAEEQPGKEIWFIYVPLNKKMSRYDVDVYNYRVVVYCKPDRQSARVRRGAATYAHLSGRVLPPIIHPFSYAHFCETDAGFSSNLAVPQDLARLPFTVGGDVSDEEMIEVVQLVHFGVSAPKRPACGSCERTDPTIIQQRVLEAAVSIQGISRQGEEISVSVAGPQPHVSLTYSCRKIDGIWTLAGTGTYIE